MNCGPKAFAFIACPRPIDHSSNDEPTAFTICERCNAVAEIQNDRSRSFIQGICARSGFQAAKTTVEIRGLCGACAAASL
jgi:Fur family transcriptional regulator, zinc uptake regulator